MSTQIIAALRQQDHLKGNALLIAKELAHRMNGSGYARVTYRFLAWKAHCSPRTAIRQIATLIDLGLIRKVVTRTSRGCDWNQYWYVGPRVHSASPPAKTHYDNVSGILPKPEEREKELALREELGRQKKGLQFWTPGSDQWTKTCEEIARLEILLKGTPHVSHP